MNTTLDWLDTSVCIRISDSIGLYSYIERVAMRVFHFSPVLLGGWLVEQEWSSVVKGTQCPV